MRIWASTLVRTKMWRSKDCIIWLYRVGILVLSIWKVPRKSEWSEARISLNTSIRAWRTRTLLSVLQYIQCIVPMPYYKNLSSATTEKFQLNTLMVPKLYTKRQLLLPYKKCKKRNYTKKKEAHINHQFIPCWHVFSFVLIWIHQVLCLFWALSSLHHPQCLTIERLHSFRLSIQQRSMPTLNVRMHCAH